MVSYKKILIVLISSLSLYIENIFLKMSLLKSPFPTPLVYVCSIMYVYMFVIVKHLQFVLEIRTSSKTIK